MLKQFALCFDLSLANHGIPSLQMVSYDTDVRGDELNSISPSKVLPVRGTPREKEGFKVRERGRDATREDGIGAKKEKVYSIERPRTYAGKGPGLSRCSPNTGNVKVKPVSDVGWSRIRDETENLVTKIFWSKTQVICEHENENFKLDAWYVSEDTITAFKRKLRELGY